MSEKRKLKVALFLCFWKNLLPSAKLCSERCGWLNNTHFNRKCLFLIAVLLLFYVLSVNCKAEANSNSLVLEAQQHWDTWGIGGTCIGGGHSLAVADVNGDGVKEIITGGSAYTYLYNGTRSLSIAPLRIWTWNGKEVTLEKALNWTGRISCVYVADVDADGNPEIITAGRVINNTNTYYQLKIWTMENNNLVLLATSEGNVTISAVAVGQGNDGKPEIVAVGSALSEGHYQTQFSIWQFDRTANALRRNSMDFNQSGRTYSIGINDFNNDGHSEIVTCGYFGDLKNSSGLLRVWQWDGQNLNLVSENKWRMVDGYAYDSAGSIQGNTAAKTLKIADVDGDAIPEIVTSGFTYDGSKVEGQLRIWNWTGNTLNLENSHEWINRDIAEHISISINDVDGDGKTEITTSGYTTVYGGFAANAEEQSRASLSVWSWDGEHLTLKQSQDWVGGQADSAWNVGTGDVDNDGRVEIITAGCMTDDRLDCDPNMRILSIPLIASSSFPYYALAIIAVALAIAGLLVAAFLFVKRKRQSK